MSVGLLSVGLLSVGLMSVGLLSVGPLSVGLMSVGPMSVGLSTLSRPSFKKFGNGKSTNYVKIQKTPRTGNVTKYGNERRGNFKGSYDIWQYLSGETHVSPYIRFVINKIENGNGEYITETTTLP